MTTSSPARPSSGRPAPGPVTLDDRYTRADGVVYLNGTQILVRLPLEQVRRDRAAGLRTGAFVSGYPGSPLGGYDLALAGARALLDEHDVVHVPAVNEELAATALRGTQLLDRYPHERFDGVTGLWYGKGPGMDRSGDALRYGNYAGTSTHGAVVVLSGEDHEAKSSALPYQQEYAFVHAGMPILYPATVAEFLELGLHAVALSRYSGCWVGMKLVGQLCDGGQTVRVHPGHPEIVVPELEIGGVPFRKRQDNTLFPGQTIETERWLFDERHPAALAYARANQLNQVTVSSPNDRIAVVTAGKSYVDTVQALRDLGLDADRLRAAGVRLVKLGMIYPLDQGFVRDSVRGVDEVIVIEEKRGFLEERVTEALYPLAQRPRVLGKRDAAGQPLFPDYGVLDADHVAERLGRRLTELGRAPASVRARLDALETIRRRDHKVTVSRTPNYCSGCPHNVSTKLLDGQVAWGSPGCHIFAGIMDQPHRQIDAIFQLGGEGVGWIGLSPFTDLDHVVQNTGDGSLFHSSYLNLRFAIASGVRMTFKILFNGYVANTGAQAPVGVKQVPELCQMLALEGATKIAVVAADPRDYRRARLPRNATVHAAGDIDDVLADLRRTPGVTVFLYDGECANERRRQQKRGRRPRPTEFVVVNDEVCEDCGHCGELTNCMSLHKTDTEFGPKTLIHQSSCNTDRSCLGGDCPSFVTVRAPEGLKQLAPAPLGADAVPEPDNLDRTVGDLNAPYQVFIPGVGGTGVLTVNALLAWAGLLDGRDVVTYDQTGAAQKWGAVLSSIAICPPTDDGDGAGGGVEAGALPANKVGLGGADLYLAFDLVAGSSGANLERCDPARTAAVINTTLLPTGEMIRNSRLEVPTDPMAASIQRCTDPARTVRVAAREIAEALFGDYMATNILALGAAYQAGLLPLTGRALEAAITLNGAAAERNLQAFRYGRLAQHDPDRVRDLVASFDDYRCEVAPSPRDAGQEQAAMAATLRGDRRAAYERLLAGFTDLDDEDRRLLAVRVGELIHYQHAAYATAYAEFVGEVARTERARVPGAGGLPVTRAVIRGLYKLMAYKDEYEVARLHLKAALQAKEKGTFAGDPKLRYNLHPPLLRAMGMRRKLQFGEWFNGVFRVLRAARRLRGTPLDPFGAARVRREERRLVGWYRDLVTRALAELTAANHQTVARIAALPDGIRGYEDIKLRGVADTEHQATVLLGQLNAPARLPVIPR